MGATLHKSLNKVGVSLPAPIHSALESALSWWSYLTGIDRSVTNTSFSPFSGSSLGATGLAAGPASNASMLDISQQLLSSLDHISPLPDKALPAPTPAKAVEVSNKPAADPIALAGGCGGSADTGSLQLAYNPNSNAFGRLSWGNYTFPLSIPAVVTSTFGWRIHPIFGDRRFHPGVDLGAPYGTPVVAAQPGRVVMADYMGGYGLAIVVENPATAQRNLYGHLSSVAVQPGMEVQKGSVIGFVGSTGNSTGPHLHFETQVMAGGDWTVIDPDRKSVV